MLNNLNELVITARESGQVITYSKNNKRLSEEILFIMDEINEDQHVSFAGLPSSLYYLHSPESFLMPDLNTVKFYGYTGTRLEATREIIDLLSFDGAHTLVILFDKKHDEYQQCLLIDIVWDIDR